MINKKITTIIPLIGDGLIDSINSLLNDSIKNNEIIVVHKNNNIEKIDGINYISCGEDFSLIQMIKKGFSNATGDYISILMPGNKVSVDLYRSLLYKAEKTKSDMVFSNYVDYLNDENVYYNLLNIVQKEIENDEILKYFINLEGLNNTWNLIDNRIISNSLFKKSINNCNEKLNSSFLLMYLLYKNAKRINKIDNDVLFNKSKINMNLDDIKLTFDTINDDKNIHIQNMKNLFCMYLIKNDISISKIKKINPNYKPVDDIDYYYLIHTKYNDELEKIKKNIINENIKLISFDIFDTLLVRPFLYPSDLFDVIDKYFRKYTNNKTATEFKNIRVNAEKLARKEKKEKNPSSQDIKFDDIYNIMKEKYKFSDDLINKLKKCELDTEMKYCSIRKTGFELYELAKFSGKKVICTSDMYLSNDFLTKLLNSKGYEFDKIYVSSEYDVTKSTGDLYDLVSKDQNTKFENILHMGDNYISDIENARKKGIVVGYLTKPTDLFMDVKITGCLSASLNEHLPFWIDNANSIMFNGIRSVIAIVANNYFDNPYKPFKNNTDFNADPYLIGYYCLGSYMFGLVKWMLDDIQNENYDKLVFMARDGYLPIKCYSIMKNFYKKRPKEEYLYISRKALIPIIIQDKMDFYKLTETLNFEKNTPLDIIKYIMLLLDYDENKFISICKENNLNPSVNIKSLSEFNKLIDIIINNFYNEEKHRKNLEIFTNYFRNIFGSKPATFDIGYSARPSYYISNLLNTPINTYFCNINHNQALRHAEMGNFKLKTFFDGKPSTTGHAYEMLLSALAPSCVAYDITDGKVKERFEDYSVSSTVSFAINTMQDAAFDFVNDICNLFGDDINILYSQNYYMGLPFLSYMNSSREIDKYPFNSVLFEDNLSMGSAKKMVRVWEDELKYRNQYNMPSLLNLRETNNDDFFTGNHLVYNSNIKLDKMSKFKRLLFYTLYDKDTLKRRISEIKHHFWRNK